MRRVGGGAALVDCLRCFLGGRGEARVVDVLGFPRNMISGIAYSFVCGLELGVGRV